MKSKKIINIVFYKFYDRGEEKRQACAFYSDGTIATLTYQEGIEACEQIAKELHITSKDAFQRMINSEMIHVMTGSEFERRFNSFVATNEQINNQEVESSKHEENTPSFKAVEGPGRDDVEEQEDNLESSVLPNLDEENNNSYEASEIEDALEDEDSLDDDFVNELNEDEENRYDSDLAADEDEFVEDTEEEYTDEEEREDDLEEDYADEEENEDEIEEDIEDDFEEAEELEEPKKRKGILGIFQKCIDKFKKNKLVRRITLCVAALAVLVTGYSVAAKKTKEGAMLNSNLNSGKSTVESTVDSKEKTTDAGKEGALITGNNDYYDNYSYEQLLEVTESKVQKDSMKNLGDTITNFNGPFADAYVEQGKDIRAALSFDEIVAIQQAYNDYSKKDIQAYFNGAEINASDMEKDYKSATLQLMGAHVIETRENPVDMSKLLNDEKAKEFYKKYHEMFLAAKEATGEDKIAKAKAFADAVRNDFPITEDVRTDGIMHRDDYDKIESYKLSVVPMIAASEMLFQNLDIDYTLSNGEIDFLNDIGLCNYAQDKFEKIETITLSSEEDNTNPLYEQYRDSIIGMLKEKNQYVTTDEKRDLSKLDAFQNAVNWHFYVDSTGMFTGEVYYTTETHTETNTWTTQQTSYREETTTTEKEIPEDEKKKIDKKIEEENKKEKTKAEKEAKKKQEEMQKEADEEADKINKEIEEEEKDLEDKIDDANDKIDENNKDDDTSNDNKVNEDDFGDHNVDFDDDYSDDQGNLDDSVENITTDPSGDQTNEELPDPNETGKDFDSQQPSDNGNNNSDNNNNNDNNDANDNNNNNNANEGGSEQNIIEYEEPVAETPKSNEELVDEYVESLANGSDEFAESYEYTK